MADAVEQAIRRRRHLIVEAGTGVGKSFAYLVPAILSVAGEQNTGDEEGDEEDGPGFGAAEGDSPIFVGRNSGQSPGKSGQSPDKNRDRPRNANRGSPPSERDSLPAASSFRPTPSACKSS